MACILHPTPHIHPLPSCCIVALHPWQALNVEVLRRIRDGSHAVKGLLLGAVANLNASQCYLDNPFLEVLGRYAREYPQRLGHVHMSKLAFAFMSLGVENEDLMQALEDGEAARCWCWLCAALRCCGCGCLPMAGCVCAWL